MKNWGTPREDTQIYIQQDPETEQNRREIREKVKRKSKRVCGTQRRDSRPDGEALATVSMAVATWWTASVGHVSESNHSH